MINDVKLISQVDEDITFDGVGYDLISYNKDSERIFIEVKTSKGVKDKPFFISKKEIDIMQGIVEEYDCKHSFIYYVSINNTKVIIKKIEFDKFSKYTLEPILYKIKSTV